MLCCEAEMPEKIARRGRLAKAVDADHRALQPDVLAPIVRDARFHRYLWEFPRQDRVPVTGVLAVEKAGRRHGHHPDWYTLVGEQLLRPQGHGNLRTRGDDDRSEERRVGKE